MHYKYNLLLLSIIVKPTCKNTQVEAFPVAPPDRWDTHPELGSPSGVCSHLPGPDPASLQLRPTSPVAAGFCSCVNHGAPPQSASPQGLAENSLEVDTTQKQLHINI